MKPRALRSRLRTALSAVPLRVKLVATVLGLAAIGLAVAATATTTALHHYLIGRVDDQLRAFAPAADRQFDAGEGNPGFGGPPGGNPGGRELPSQFYLAFYSASGQREGYQSAPLGSQSPPSLPSLTPSQASARSHSPFTVSSLDGHSSWRVLTAVRPDGTGSVAVASPLGDVDHTVSQVILLEVITGAAVLVLMGAAGYLLIRRSLRPLVSVEHTAAAIAAGDLSQRVPQLPERTEVGRLSRALNGMLAQIEHAFTSERESRRAARSSEERMRRFVADASHELRTPLTSIRGYAELYRMGAAGSPEEVAPLMGRIESEAERMGGLVEDLLLLARLDQQRPLEREPVDLLALAADVVRDAQVIAPDRAVVLETHSPTPPVVVGDEARLRQVLHNLIANALTHTPPGTPVSIDIRTTQGPTPTVVVEIADRGPGVPPEDAERIFERFYRAERSRSRAAGGAGLGLSIVAGLVQAHGGQVRVRAREGGGAVFAVELPHASDRASPAAT